MDIRSCLFAVRARCGRVNPALAFTGVFLALALFFSGWTLGAQRSGSVQVDVEGDNSSIAGMGGGVAPVGNINMGMFWDVWSLVKERHYKQTATDTELYYGALHGMVAAAGDPYTNFFDPKEAADFQESLSGKFDGIGAQIDIRDDQLQVLAPLPDTPASRAGLMTGDKIITIDGEPTAGLTLDQAIMRIRGVKGTTVTLGITRDGLEELQDVPIVRDTIVIKSVKWEMSDDRIATISIYTFNQDTSGLFNRAVNEILAKDPKGIILDLRGNPGGLLSSAIDVASSWVGYRQVLIEKTPVEETTFKGVSAPRLEEIRTMVLVNGGSASGSEIVAGALQDYALATLVGTKTFGKGSVQDYTGLPDGSAVKITIAQWFTPSGRVINDIGISPDIEIAYTPEDKHEERDPQKDKALELLRAPAQKSAQTP